MSTPTVLLRAFIFSFCYSSTQLARLTNLMNAYILFGKKKNEGKNSATYDFSRSALIKILKLYMSVKNIYFFVHSFLSSIFNVSSYLVSSHFTDQIVDEKVWFISKAYINSGVKIKYISSHHLLISRKNQKLKTMETCHLV